MYKEKNWCSSYACKKRNCSIFSSQIPQAILKTYTSSFICNLKREQARLPPLFLNYKKTENTANYNTTFLIFALQQISHKMRP